MGTRWESLFCIWVAPKSGAVMSFTQSSLGPTAIETTTLLPPGGLNAYGIRMVYQSTDLTALPAPTLGSTSSSSSSSNTGSADSADSQGLGESGLAGPTPSEQGASITTQPTNTDLASLETVDNNNNNDTNSNFNSNGGLNQAGTIAIAVVLPVLAVVAAIALFLWWRSRRALAARDVGSQEKMELGPSECSFLDVVNYPPADGRRQKLLAHFNVPEFVANRTCFELNGYFGSKASHDAQPSVTGQDAKQPVVSFTTWFRCLVKMVKKEKDAHDDHDEYVPKHETKDYKWFEMSFFTRWDCPDNTSQVLCVDTPPDFPSELKTLLEQRTQPLNFRDPFSMHAGLVDQIIVYADVSVWRVRDPVRHLEKTRMRTGAIFGPIHEMSRHAIHTSEILDAAIDTLKEMQHRQTTVHESLHADLDETYREQAKDYAQFQISLVKSLKLRSDSNQERLKNEINLAFNTLARQDNSVMKSIALLTMIFLPATFISALFSTTFFNYGDDGSWQVSGKLWIYWITTVPATIIIVVLWRIWLANSDPITRFLKGCLAWASKQWKKRKASVQHDSKKVEQA
ncbi:hypothetical protein C8A00DRAFT_31001 [Chaetomidium leptoderma]|uniref:Uncharacterized protein n=1 Tax=Chaetomidium leptoderma TaxID=669021 RepID=A0AAN6VSS2_9PEZI|nr:hypothetical protein C8A00DRAFT_31001 [Chaetomidium leptoderma]